jgi:hypothetical protein
LLLDESFARLRFVLWKTKFGIDTDAFWRESSVATHSTKANCTRRHFKQNVALSDSHRLGRHVTASSQTAAIFRRSISFERGGVKFKSKGVFARRIRHGD